MRRRFWPWTSILAFVVFGTVIVLFIVAFAGELAQHQWSRVIGLIATLAFILAGSTVVLWRLRNRLDYYIESDGVCLRRWSPAASIAVRREELVGVVWQVNGFVVQGLHGEISVTRAYAGYKA